MLQGALVLALLIVTDAPAWVWVTVAALTALCLIVMWRTRVEVTETGIRLYHPVRSKVVPWDTITDIHVRVTPPLRAVVLETATGPLLAEPLSGTGWFSDTPVREAAAQLRARWLSSQPAPGR